MDKVIRAALKIPFCRIEGEMLGVVLAWSVSLASNAKFKSKLALGFIQVVTALLLLFYLRYSPGRF